MRRIFISAVKLRNTLLLKMIGGKQKNDPHHFILKLSLIQKGLSM